MTSPAGAAGKFIDDDGSVHEGYIEALADEGITQGCTSNRYCPSGGVLRGQMASFLARGFDLPTPTKDHFSDDNGSTHEDNINRIAEAGITEGGEGGLFRPSAVVTRAQMATFIARAADLPAASKDYFSDDNRSTHEDNINRIAEAGITVGDSSGNYQPAATVNRAQMATFLGRALGIEPVLTQQVYMRELLPPVENSNSVFRWSEPVTANGTTYTNGVLQRDGNCGGGASGYNDVDLSREWRQFETTVALTDDTRADVPMEIVIYIDGAQAFKQTFSLGEEATVSLDITGALRLRFEWTRLNQSYCGFVGWGDPVLRA